MNIHFDNITLRAIEFDDLVVLHRMINDETIESMTGGWSFPVSFEQQKCWYEAIQNEKNSLRCAIDVNETGMAGVVMLTDLDWKNRNAEIHIKVVNDEKFRRKGIAHKAINAMVQYAFTEMNMHCIYSRILAHNIPSINMVEKCGFTKEGIQKQRVFKKGGYKDVFVLSIINPEHGQ